MGTIIPVARGKILAESVFGREKPTEAILGASACMNIIHWDM